MRQVLFLPGITIPAMVQLVEAHGLQPVGVDPVSPQKMLPAKLAHLVTPKTKMVARQGFRASLFNRIEIVSIQCLGNGCFTWYL